MWWTSLIEGFLDETRLRASTRQALGLRTSRVSETSSVHYGQTLRKWLPLWAEFAKAGAEHRFRLGDLVSIQAFFAAHDGAARPGRGRDRADAERMAGGMPPETQNARVLLESFVVFCAARPGLRAIADAYIIATTQGDRGGPSMGDRTLPVFLAYLGGEEGVDALGEALPGVLVRYRAYIGEHATTLGTAWSNRPFTSNAVTAAERLLAFGGAPHAAWLQPTDRPSCPPWRFLEVLRNPVRRDILTLLARTEAASGRGMLIDELVLALEQPAPRIRSLVNALVRAGVLDRVREQADATSPGPAPCHLTAPKIVVAFERAVASIATQRVAAAEGKLGTWVREMTAGSGIAPDLFRSLLTGSPPPMGPTSARAAAGRLIRSGLVEQIGDDSGTETRWAVPQDVADLARSTDLSPSPEAVDRWVARIRAAVGVSLGHLGMTPARFAALEVLATLQPGALLRPSDIRRLTAARGGEPVDDAVVDAFVALGHDCGALVFVQERGRTGYRLATPEVVELVSAAVMAAQRTNAGLAHDPGPAQGGARIL